MRFSLSFTLLSLLSLSPLLANDLRAEETPTADGAANSSEKHLLRYKFKPGEKIRWSVGHQGASRTTIQGTTQTVKTQSASVKVWLVKSVSPEEIVFEHSVESVHMVNNISGRAKVEYNSKTDKKVPPGYETIAKTIGVPLTVVKMNSSGKILSRKDLVPSIANSKDTPIAIPLPREAVAIGAVWTEPHTAEVTIKGQQKKNLQTRRRFELKSVKHGVATIHVEYQVLTPHVAPELMMQIVHRITEGHVKFDLDAGRVLSQQHDMDKRVLGFSGPASSSHQVSRFQEKLLSAKEEVASNPANKTAQSTGGDSTARPAEKVATKPDTQGATNNDVKQK